MKPDWYKVPAQAIKCRIDEQCSIENAETLMNEDFKARFEVSSNFARLNGALAMEDCVVSRVCFHFFKLSILTREREERTRRNTCSIFYADSGQDSHSYLTLILIIVKFIFIFISPIM